jgi:hypothetical protein
MPGMVKDTCMIYVNRTLYCTVYKVCPAPVDMAKKCYDNYNSFGEKGFCPMDITCYHQDRDNTMLIFTVCTLTFVGALTFLGLLCTLQAVFDETTVTEKAKKVASIFYPTDWKTRGSYGTV